MDITSSHPNSRAIPNDRAIFDIKGGRYRIVVAINYPFSIVYIRFVGTHGEYDSIDPLTI